MVEMIEAIKKEPEDGTTAENQEGAGPMELGVHEEEIASGKAKKRRRRRKQSVSDPQKKRPCLDCTRRCARVHGRAASASSGKAPPPAPPPSFFKVMMGHFSENMDIPPPFAKTVSDLADSNVYLEDAFGLRWRVRLSCSRDGGRLSFGHGWKNFVLDHAVAVGEFLVFRHIARSVFAVQIFAKSACERLYLCKKNQRQSRKRKPKEKTSSVGDGTVKMSKKSSKKKQRTDCDTLDGDQDQAQYDQDNYHVADANTGTENCEGSSFLTGAEPRTPLAMMMGREEEITVTDDIFLTADAYEFETDFCNQGPFSGELGTEELVSHGRTSGFGCAQETSLRNGDSSVGVCLEDKEITSVLVASTDEGYVPVQDMDMNGLPSEKLSELREENSSPKADAQFPSSECATDTCKKDQGKSMFASEGNQLETKEGLVPEESSMEHDNPQMQDGTGQVAAEINSGSPKPPHLHEPRQKGHMQPEANDHESLRSGNLKPSNRRFCFAVPPQDQTWLELPCRLPVLPRRKKHGRKVLVVEDPRARRWPVLYLCTPSFSGLVVGWVDILAGNSLREGDICELELHGSNSNLALRVCVPGSQ